MTPLINFTNPLSIILALILFVLVILLAKETKKSIFPCIMLGIFLTILIGHAIEFYFIDASIEGAVTTIAFCIAVDFAFILISFFSYLWIDDIETKAIKKKSIDNSLDWFWSKV